MRGRFITFEGGEGGGKSTQVALLAERLRERGIEVVETREPGGSPGAEIIRHVLLSGAAKSFGPEAEAILFAAARDDHVRMKIAPALARGAWVLSDRFADSTRVYQGIVGEVDIQFLAALERVTIGDLKPDLTLVLDIPAEAGLARAAKRRGMAAPDRFEGEGATFHARLRDAFLKIAAEAPERCVVIDAKQPRAKVAARIWSVVKQRLDPSPARAPEAETTS